MSYYLNENKELMNIFIDSFKGVSWTQIKCNQFVSNWLSDDIVLAFLIYEKTENLVDQVDYTGDVINVHFGEFLPSACYRRKYNRVDIYRVGGVVDCTCEYAMQWLVDSWGLKINND